MTFLFDLWSARSDPSGYARRIGVRMAGKVSIYGNSRTMFGSEPFLIGLGDNVHICDGARFITHDGGVLALRHRFPRLDLAKPITVGSNVVIGCAAIIMPGVVIGDDCVIGAGSVVTRSIPSGSVAVGNPARVIKSTRDYLTKAMVNSLDVGHLPHSEKLKAYQALLDGVGAADLQTGARAGRARRRVGRQSAVGH